MIHIMYSVKWNQNGGAAVRVTRKQAAANRDKVLDMAGTLFRDVRATNERGFKSRARNHHYLQLWRLGA